MTLRLFDGRAALRRFGDATGSAVPVLHAIRCQTSPLTAENPMCSRAATVIGPMEPAVQKIRAWLVFPCILRSADD
jgi:hypothetical protein